MKRLKEESALLLQCGDVTGEAGTPKRIGEILDAGIDWEALLELASSHGMSPLLLNHLRHACPERVPNRHMSKLQHRCDEIAERNRFKAAETTRLVECLKAEGITGIPFKGPVLAMSVYGDTSLRQFGDIDMLVREDDMSRTREVLLSQGYRLRGRRGHVRETLQPDGPYHVFVREGHWLVVDIQSTIAGGNFAFRIDHEEVWRRLRPVALGAGTVWTLSPEDTLLILCIHGSKHLWKRLLWIVDVAQLIRTSPDMDFEYLARRCRSLGCCQMLALGLLLARDLLDVSFANKMLAELPVRPGLRPLVDEVRGRLSDDGWSKVGEIERCLFFLRLKDSVRDRWKYRIYLCCSLDPPRVREVGPGLALVFYSLFPGRWLLKQFVGLRHVKGVVVRWLAGGQ